MDLDSLSHLAPELAAAIAAIASDIALVVDQNGIVRDVAIGRDTVDQGTSEWIGKQWADTATADTRKKIQLLLEEANHAGVSQRREINHKLDSGASLAMMYAAVRLGEHGPVLIAGRDLRAITAIQQRFVESQQEMEKTYWTQRQAESRYRLLFQAATDAVLVVDALTLRVLDANPSAVRVLEIRREHLIGAGPFESLDNISRRAAEDLLDTARSSARPLEIRIRIGAARVPLTVSATPFRGDKEMLLLVRMSALDETRRSTTLDVQMSGALESMSESVLVTDSGGRLVMANGAFLRLCELPEETQIKGLSIGEWLTSSEMDLGALLGAVRHRGMSHAVPAILKTLTGRAVAVELYAALMTDGEQEHIGITLRRKSLAQADDTNALQQLHGVLESLIDSVGTIPIAEMLEKLQQVATKQFATVALQRADGSATLAAKMLGLSSQEFERCMEGRASDDKITSPTSTSLH